MGSIRGPDGIQLRQIKWRWIAVGHRRRMLLCLWAISYSVAHTRTQTYRKTAEDGEEKTAVQTQSRSLWEIKEWWAGHTKKKLESWRHSNQEGKGAAGEVRSREGGAGGRRNVLLIKRAETTTIPIKIDRWMAQIKVRNLSAVKCKVLLFKYMRDYFKL